MSTKAELISFLTDLMNGINPVNKQEFPADHFFNNIEAIRKLHEIVMLLNQTEEKTEKVAVRKPKVDYGKGDFIFPDNLEDLINGDATITVILKALNEKLEVLNNKKLKLNDVTNKLIEWGYLYVDENDKKLPTEKGLETGISVRKKYIGYGKYVEVINYSPKAQLVILEEIKACYKVYGLF